jgi:DNA-binding SARP family transcriptional activator/ABC-type branched-subunit amino acid transport system substrate-binding protein
VEFRLLGLLEVAGAQHDVDPPAGKERALLALLLLHANAPVSTEELVVELWDGAPPTNATKNVQTYISRARRRLGKGRITTTPAGYTLRVEPGELDVERFEQLVSDGDAALSDGRLEEAYVLLSRSLALWRGPALADFRFESFAQAEIRRLENLRERVKADRNDAMLGRNPERAIPDIELLIGSNPLWERPRAQLMLALYQCGRQSEALEIYRTTRTLLNDELGIEPGPELQQLHRAILNQDPELKPGAAPPCEPPEPEPPRSHRRRILAAIAAAVIAAAGATAALLPIGGGRPTTTLVKPGSVAIIDPTSRRVVAQQAIPGSPSKLAAAGKLIWVWGEASHTLSALRRSNLALGRLLAPGGSADQLEPGRGGVWMLDSTARRLIFVDSAYGDIKSRTSFPAAKGVASVQALETGNGEQLTAVRMTIVGRDVWITDGGTNVDEFDVSGTEPRLVRTVDLKAPLDDIAAGEGAVWVLSGTGASVFELNPQTGKVRTRVSLESRPSLAAPFPIALTAGLGAVWVLGGNAATVTRIDPADGAVTTTVQLPVDSDPTAIAAGAGAVWIADSGNGFVSRIDPVTNALTSIRVGGAPTALAVTGQRVAVSVQPSLGSAQAAPAAVLSPTVAASLGALPAAFCSPVYFDGRHLPKLLIAADLPLQGNGNLEQTLQMSDAVRYELARSGFRAGPYPIGYQLCDDSSAQYDAWSPQTCTRNARAFAAAPRVVGIIGPFNSGCAQEEIPIADAAPAGPLPLVSATATYIGLTATGAGTAKGEPGIYYPRHIRNFVRVVADDSAQGTADALVAQRLGVKSLYLLEDDNAYGDGLAAAVSAAARKLGIRIAGRATWGSSPTSLTRLARRIKRTNASGVFIGGAIDESGDQLIVALRSVLGPRERIITPDGFTPLDQLLKAGSAANGVTVSIAETDPTRLTGRGAAFVKGLAEATGTPTQPYSVSIAQATDTLLAAIAHSNGSRPSVNAHLRSIRVVNGILGSFRFDPNGDTTAGVVTIYRVENGHAPVWNVLTAS